MTRTTLAEGFGSFFLQLPTNHSLIGTPKHGSRVFHLLSDSEDNSPLPSRQTFASERPSSFLDFEASNDLANNSDRNAARKIYQNPTAVLSKLRIDHIKNQKIIDAKRRQLELDIEKSKAGDNATFRYNGTKRKRLRTK